MRSTRGWRLVVGRLDRGIGDFIDASRRDGDGRALPVSASESDRVAGLEDAMSLVSDSDALGLASGRRE
jgi:hypothetical protein